jgi:hypothetical protein
MPGKIRSLIQDIEDKFENTFHKAHMVAGICNSPNLEQVKDLLEHGEQLTNRAKTTVDFANSAQILGQAGERLGGAADAIDKLVSQGSKAAGDISAACEISEAISVLNDWSNSKASSQEAAKAFDQLFGGAARYMGKLPFPANAYAKLLSAIHDYNFFANMQRTMDIENPNSPEGSQLRELERQGY